MVGISWPRTWGMERLQRHSCLSRRSRSSATRHSSGPCSSSERVKPKSSEDESRLLREREINVASRSFCAWFPDAFFPGPQRNRNEVSKGQKEDEHSGSERITETKYDQLMMRRNMAQVVQNERMRESRGSLRSDDDNSF